jgi:hypothetical protein
MANRYPRLDAELVDFIRRQKLFFVATAAREGKVNVSPKGMDTLRVIDESRLIWLNLTGNGNETAAHLLDNNRMTLMFCSFDQAPLILRLYGEAETLHPRDPAWQELIEYFPHYPGARQIFDLQSKSCRLPAASRYRCSISPVNVKPWKPGRIKKAMLVSNSTGLKKIASVLMACLLVFSLSRSRVIDVHVTR